MGSCRSCRRSIRSTDRFIRRRARRATNRGATVRSGRLPVATAGARGVHDRRREVARAYAQGMSELEIVALGVGDTFTEKHFTTALLVRAAGFSLAIDCPDTYRKGLAGSGDAAGEGDKAP